MEAKVKALEEELKKMRDRIVAWEVAHLGMMDSVAQTVLWLGNLENALVNKGILDESDLASIKNTKEELERFRRGVYQEKLLHSADEEKPN